MPSERLSRIEIEKERLNFSSAHFTIFNATEREDLHGHNWQVRASVLTPIGDDGLTFDYAILKKLLQRICDSLDEKTLLPAKSPYLEVEEHEGGVTARYGNEQFTLLARDVLVLPVANVTVEDLAWYLLERVKSDPDLAGHDIRELTLGVSSSPGQWGLAEWKGA